MQPETPTTPPPAPRKGYGKRPMWQWVVIYLVLAAIVYGLVYYFFFRNGGSSTGSLY